MSAPGPMPTVSDVSTVPYSGDLRVDALLHLSAGWNYLLPARSTLYYTFDLGVIDGETAQPIAAFNEIQKAAARAILQHAGALTGIAFAEVASGAQADFHFAACDLDTAGLCRTEWSYSYGAGNVLTAYSADAYIYLDNVQFAADNGAPTPGTSGYEVLLHEIGHALGLDHPFDTPYPLPAEQDNTGNTVMSYTHVGADKTTFQPYDLLALSWIYGGDGLGGMLGYNSTFGPALDDSAVDTANRAPLAVADEYTVAEDGTLSADVLQNDSDPDGQPLTARLLAGPANGTIVLDPDGRFTYTPRADFNGTDGFTYAASDGGLETTAAVSISVAGIVDEIFGTALDDDLRDTSGEARLYGFDGNDRLQGGSGDDRLDGGAGIDTAVYARAAAGYTLSRTGADWRVTDDAGNEGADTLVDIERLRFADRSIALDLDGAAGNTAKLIGAIFGPAHLLPAYVGIGISLFDNGASLAEVAGFALDTGLYAELAGSASNVDFVRRVYANVVGSEPGAAEQAHYQGILDRGEATQAQLAIFAAGTSENAASIDFVGLAGGGIEFVPFGT